MRLRYRLLNVFAREGDPFSGNPLCVFEDGSGLSDDQMLALARQFNLSETIFVMAPRHPAHRARVRIFLPLAEIPFAGHPTIGCALHLSAGDGDLVLEEEAGPVPVTIRDGLAEFAAPVLPQLGDAVAADLAAAGLGLGADRIGFGTHRPVVAHAGPAFIFVPLRDAQALSDARPAGAAFEALTAKVGKVYAYAPDGAGFRARMFAPGSGVPEDPATGSATATLAAPLLAAGVLPEGEARLSLRQGVEMGRPSQLGLRITVRGGALAQVRVSGRAVPVAQGRIRIPEDT